MEKDCTFFIKPVSDLGEVTIERIIFNFNGSIREGYLHLLEHLWVRANKSWFDDYESKMNIFNALTNKNRITFILVYTESTVNTNKLIFDLNFNEQDFLIEKKTIYEERKLYSDSTPDVDIVLGSLRTIEAFDLTVLKNMMHQMNYKKIRFHFSSKNNGKYMKNPTININKYSIIWKDSNTIQLIDFYDYKVLLTILKVFKITNDNFCFNVNEAKGNYEITFDDYEVFDFMLKNKDNVLMRYQLLLTNTQLFIEQTTYLFDLFGFNFDILDFWREFNWEVLEK
ncbi:hypothetical protein HMPREF2764_03325 [Streptococcus sp. HMSC073F11]|uniref:hypothetical protein n=1 Tax=unclassified Streptococcus TaxID=2608887 RepID=UPI0008A24D7B|nr:MULTISPECIES: hypothetical protein [unclassified Streptococcus]OFL55344.1 hypothetical protein HMPREF2764_03325 [Streptococcus sp. HMSC073F11]OFL63737.1 hypothetical protein HMPREF2761_00465 [Streptococcus sp. HMSC057E02]